MWGFQDAKKFIAFVIHKILQVVVQNLGKLSLLDKAYFHDYT